MNPNIPVSRSLLNSIASYNFTKHELRVLLGLIELSFDDTGAKPIKRDVAWISKTINLDTKYVENALITLNIKNVIDIVSIDKIDQDGIKEAVVVRLEDTWRAFEGKKVKTIKEKEIPVEIVDLFNYWNSKNIFNHIKISRGPLGLEGFILRALKTYENRVIRKAMDNYAIVLSDPKKYWYTWRFKLSAFLDRGIDRFLDKNKPLERLVSKTYLEQEKKKQLAGVSDVDAKIREEENARKTNSNT